MRDYQDSVQEGWEGMEWEWKLWKTSKVLHNSVLLKIVQVVSVKSCELGLGLELGVDEYF